MLPYSCNIDAINESKALDNNSFLMGTKNTCHPDVTKISDNIETIPDTRDDTNPTQKFNSESSSCYLVDSATNLFNIEIPAGKLSRQLCRL
jgi:hypothetical protein